MALALPARAQHPVDGGPRHRAFGSRAHGSIVVYIRGENGGALSLTPEITLISQTYSAPVPSVPEQAGGNGWVFSDVAGGDSYDVVVKAQGYITVHQTAILPNIDGATANVVVFLKKDNTVVNHSTGAQFVLAPRAQKEVQNGLKELRSHKFSAAEKHFKKALQMAPGNPYVNYLMGMSYLLAQQFTLAGTYLEKSLSIDPEQTGPLMALGSLRLQQANYAAAVQVLNKAVELDHTNWKAEWMLATGYLHQGDYQQARVHAQKAIKIGKEKASQAELVLADALARTGDLAGAQNAVKTFLKEQPDDADAARARAWLEELHRLQSSPAHASSSPHS